MILSRIRFWRERLLRKTVNGVFESHRVHSLSREYHKLAMHLDLTWPFQQRCHPRLNHGKSQVLRSSRQSDLCKHRSVISIEFCFHILQDSALQDGSELSMPRFHSPSCTNGWTYVGCTLHTLWPEPNSVYLLVGKGRSDYAGKCSLLYDYERPTIQIIDKPHTQKNFTFYSQSVSTCIFEVTQFLIVPVALLVLHRLNSSYSGALHNKEHGGRVCGVDFVWETRKAREDCVGWVEHTSKTNASI